MVRSSSRTEGGWPGDSLDGCGAGMATAELAVVAGGRTGSRLRVAPVQVLPRRLSVRIYGSLTLEAGTELQRVLRRTRGVIDVQLRRRAGRLAIDCSDPAGVMAAWGVMVRMPTTSAIALERTPCQAQTHANVADTGRGPQAGLVSETLWFALGRFLPTPLRVVMAVRGALPYIQAGLASLRKGKLDAAVLDGAAIGSALLSRQYSTAGLIGYLLTVGEYLEELTIVQGEHDLTRLLAYTEGTAQVIRAGVEQSVAQQDVLVDDLVVLRASYIVPVDGVVVEGEVQLNQAVMTGEPWPVAAAQGAAVYAGASVVEGTCTVRVSSAGHATRLAQMARIIADTQQHKSDFESYAARLSDRTVPYVLSAAALVYLSTFDWLRASAVLLVDFSCALKLSVPMVLRTGVLQAGEQNILSKGAQWLERLANVDAIAFDKTGTLTKGWPRLVEVVPFNGYSKEYLLRNAACLEEHFSHPIASAIVQAAEQAGLEHAIETHGPLNYLVSYGVVSTVNGETVLVGGKRALDAHGIDISLYLEEIAAREQGGLSLVFVAIGGQLAGLITLDDELRGEAEPVVEELRRQGIRKLVMLTGDRWANAERVAGLLGLDECHAELLPDQKVALLEDLKRQGYTVAMLGDGLNDGPALSTADVGMSVASGSDLTRDVANIVLTDGSLESLGDAFLIARATMARAKRTFSWVMGINSTLLVLDLLGWIGPSRSALFHNASTVVLSLNAARRSPLPKNPQKGRA